ncbi:glycosyltransferase [Streptomyces sp. NPDC058625]|uniref:glycosyltransferase n=1 Tax=Streptomyces sp. NPDC058625 TaxID=3346564 RepID=UPI00364CB1D6
MRFLFVTGGGSAPVHAGIPLVWAARSAGHDVLVACPRENTELIAGLGLPAYPVTDLGMADAILKDREGNWLPMPTGSEKEQMDFAGRGFARLSAGCLEGTMRLAESWQPDVIVGGEYNHAAHLVAYRLGIPLVSHTWAIYDRTDVDWQGATSELEPELSAMGLDAIPEPVVFLDITPPSVRPSEAVPAEPMRWTPGNQQVPLEPWMCERGDRPRIVITSGSRSMFVPTLGMDFFRPLLDNPAVHKGDFEIVVATSPAIAGQLKETWPDIRAGYVPLDVLAPTTDLVVHHGGGVTVMTVLNAGVPQLVLPEIPASAIPMRRVDEFGASLTMDSATESADAVAAAMTTLLSEPSYRERAGELSRQIAAMPSPARVVERLEKLV